MWMRWKIFKINVNINKLEQWTRALIFDFWFRVMRSINKHIYFFRTANMKENLRQKKKPQHKHTICSEYQMGIVLWEMRFEKKKKWIKSNNNVVMYSNNILSHLPFSNNVIFVSSLSVYWFMFEQLFISSHFVQHIISFSSFNYFN